MALGLLTSTLRVLKNLRDDTGNLVQHGVQWSETKSHKVRSRLKLILISGCVCGIEFCYSAETAFVSPILLTSGVPMSLMTIIWCLSPLVGFFIVPILGSFSDNCKSPLGRRRPFIFLLSCGIIIGLLLVPYGAYMGETDGNLEAGLSTTLDTNSHITPEKEVFTEVPGISLLNNCSSKEMNQDISVTVYNATAANQTCDTPYCNNPSSIALITMGVILLDFSCDACQSPCRAYLLDVTRPSEHAAGLATFTIMAGIGGTVGYILGGIDWSYSYGAETMSSMEHIKIVFTAAIVLYILLTFLTMISYQEVTNKNANVKARSSPFKVPSFMRALFAKRYKQFEDDDLEIPTDNHSVSETYFDQALINNEKLKELQLMPSKQEQTIPTYESDENDVFSANSSVAYGTIDDVSVHSQGTDVPDTSPSSTLRSGENSAPETNDIPTEIPLSVYLWSIIKMPKSLAILCLTNLFCWMSLVCYSLYFTNFVGEAVYGGDPLADEGTPTRRLYNEGVRAGSMGMALYSITCSIYSLSLETLVKRFGAKPIYVISQLVYTVGAVIMAATKNKIVILVCSPTAGIMYATLFTMPYMLVAHYHSNKKFGEKAHHTDQNKQDQIRGIGTDVALVSSMVFVAQFALSLSMGSIIDAVGSMVAVMCAAAILSFCGAVTAMNVYYGGL